MSLFFSTLSRRVSHCWAIATGEMDWCLVVGMEKDFGSLGSLIVWRSANILRGYVRMVQWN